MLCYTSPDGTLGGNRARLCVAVRSVDAAEQAAARTRQPLSARRPALPGRRRGHGAVRGAQAACAAGQEPRLRQRRQAPGRRAARRHRRSGAAAVRLAGRRGGIRLPVAQPGAGGHRGAGRPVVSRPALRPGVAGRRPRGDISRAAVLGRRNGRLPPRSAGCPGLHLLGVRQPLHVADRRSHAAGDHLLEGRRRGDHESGDRSCRRAVDCGAAHRRRRRCCWGPPPTGRASCCTSPPPRTSAPRAGNWCSPRRRSSAC